MKYLKQLRHYLTLPQNLFWAMLSSCCLISCGGSSSIASSTPNNLPWYPSLQAFEDYNSGRSHLFAQAQFNGSFTTTNRVNTTSAIYSYPSVSNMAYLDANNAVVYGGAYGGIQGSVGAFVANINPNTLKLSWYRQLIDTSTSSEWNYPGSMGILNDGYIYASYGYRLAKLDVISGDVVSTLTLPTGQAQAADTAYNGFNATADGTLIMTSLYRQAGCNEQGPSALINCPNPLDVPLPLLVSVNPTTMQVIDSITLPTPIKAKPTVTEFDGKTYVYLVTSDSVIRYTIEQGKFRLDNSWNPSRIIQHGQNLGSPLVVVGKWVITQTSTQMSPIPLTVVAINQADSNIFNNIQPFYEYNHSPLMQGALARKYSPQDPITSWSPAGISADTQDNLIYTSDAIAGKIAALSVTDLGLVLVWKANQITTEFATLINSEGKRVIVSTDIPETEVPGSNLYDYVVWRDSKTGAELARSELLPAITPTSAVQPSYSGEMFYPSMFGELIKLQAVAQ